MKNRKLLWVSFVFLVVTASVVLVRCGKDDGPSYSANANGMKF